MNALFSAETIQPDQLLSKVETLRKLGFRLTQIAGLLEKQGMESFIRLIYSFDQSNSLRHLQVLLPAEGATIPSITPVYWAAFLYENEIHDLYHVQVNGLAVDFHGALYKTAIKFPFGSTKAPVTKAPAEERPNA